MTDGLLTTSLIDLWRKEFELCRVQDGEVVIVYTEPEYPYPFHIGAAVAAARGLGAIAYVMTAPDVDTFFTPSVRGAWKSADLVVTLLREPFIYSQAHNEILATGTRTLLVQDTIANMRRLFPHEDVRRRTYAGAERMAAAKKIRVVDEMGSDFTFDKEGRKGHAQVGVADRPGMWDNWPSGIVACAPHEESGEGIYTINPGDIIQTIGRHVETQIELTIKEGVVTEIKGGYDAAILRELIESFDHPGSYKWSHAGWGTEHRAQWHDPWRMDIESKYASVMVSLGSNIFEAPDKHSGIGGRNDTPCHIDICTRKKAFFLDDEMILNTKEEFAIPELA